MRRLAFGLLPLVISSAAFAADQLLVLGQTLTLNGPAAHVGQALGKGRQACVDWVNKSGALPGYRLRLETRDDGGDPRRAIANAAALVESEKAVALLGPMGTSTGEALLQWAGSTQVAVIGPYGGEIGLRQSGADHAFFITASQSLEAERIAAHMASLGISRVAVVRSMNPAGQASLVALEEALGASGIPPAVVVGVDPSGTDAPKAVAALQAAGVQAVALATNGRSTSAMLRALGEASQGARVRQVYGLSSTASLADLAEAGATGQAMVMTQVLPSARDPRAGLALRLRQALPEAAARPMHVEMEGCLAVLVLADVLRRKPIDATRAGVLRALRSAGLVSLGGYDVDLADRMRGARYTDIIFIGPDGRSVR